MALPMNAAQNSILTGANTATGMWASNPGVITSNNTYPYERNHNVSQFQVERVDNGFVLRSGSKAKVCKDMEELRDFFVAIMVEHQMDK
jgi:hypothetical protein